jgi:hypothetical protein
VECGVERGRTLRGVRPFHFLVAISQRSSRNRCLQSADPLMSGGLQPPTYYKRQLEIAAP